MQQIQDKLSILAASLEGDLYYDHTMRVLYATDASVYRELPLAVAMPKNADDLKQLIHFARTEKTSLIPRTAGTSLAGQCVGEGIVVDTSRYMTGILEVNKEESWVKVQPGVIRDDLNKYLRPYGLFFGPNTSTANRAMIGGMVGNNSCGSYSIVYGTTRDHVIELKTILSDGSEAVFGPLTQTQFEEKCALPTLEGQIYRHIREELSQPGQQEEIRREFPRKELHRRNTGYAVDVLLDSEVFTEGGTPFNFCKLIAGSEGTLAFHTEIKIHVDPLPPRVTGLICIHHTSVAESLKAVLVALKHNPRAVELMDKIVMDCTKGNRLYQKNRFFVEGDPHAILVIELGGDTKEEVEARLLAVEADMRAENYGYAYPRVFGPDINKVWDLRSAGLGLLSNVPGDAKPVAVIEDTAVYPDELPDYIAAFSKMMETYGQQAVYYAHAGAGELHLRPILDLKSPKDRKLFRDIAQSTAELVKKYRGSLSGEHGDGRVRAEFIPLMVGENNYQLLRRIKQTWDPVNIFNPGKIVDAPPMDVSLRYEGVKETRQFDTVFDFSDSEGILRAAEKCNGSGDCRKTHLSGGTMCPSYMATRDEKDTTRARANILREILTRSNDENPFASEEIHEVMDLCLGCKGCASECPSNVNVATLKAEFLHQYYKKSGVPMRAKAFAGISRLNNFAAIAPGISNFFMGNALSGGLMKKALGVAAKRNLPAIYKTTLRKWFDKQVFKPVNNPKGTLYFFFDEFTNFNDVEAGIKAIQLLHRLNYEVKTVAHAESARGYISKGLLPTARRIAMYNVEVFKDIITEETPLIGIEPSAILGFRDEYPKLVIKEYRETAEKLGKNALLIDEFLAREIAKGNISKESFTTGKKHILLHGHCHQKALSSVEVSRTLLSLPENYTVELIPSGCCGMAGSFGYEKEHYDVSMKIGELVLFPTVRKAENNTIIAAPGTSCRHQIADGTGRKALHPAEILWEALS
ncbi:MAG: FAD-linked oxidase C-terminal domain-containing protein [Bacteroidia bacterium]